MPEGEADAVVRIHDDAVTGTSPATAVQDVLWRPAIGVDVGVIDHAAEFARSRAGKERDAARQ